MIGAAVLVTACAGGVPGLTDGPWRGPSLAALQQMCGEEAADFGPYAGAVHSATFDAYVASRRGRVSHEQFCAFQAGLAQQYAKLSAGGDADSRDSHDSRDARAQWITYLNEQRATALSWRAFVDPTLRSG